MEVFTHHQAHSLSQDSATESLMMMQPPPPTLSRLPPDGHEFPPDYRDPSNTFQVSILFNKNEFLGHFLNSLVVRKDFKNYYGSFALGAGDKI